MKQEVGMLNMFVASPSKSNLNAISTTTAYWHKLIKSIKKFKFLNLEIQSEKSSYKSPVPYINFAVINTSIIIWS